MSVCLSLSPLMVTLTVLASAGLTPFSAVHVYLPSSLLSAAERRSEPLRSSSSRGDPDGDDDEEEEEEDDGYPYPESLVQTAVGSG